MKNRGKVFVLVFAAGLLAMAAGLPKLLVHAVPTAEVVLPVQVEVTPFITCGGVLQAEEMQEVYATRPLMIEAVLVQEGESVTRGSVLATLDTQTTDGLASANMQSADAAQLEQYMAAARQYGMEDELQTYLQSQKTATTATQPAQPNLVAPRSGRVLSLGVQPGCLADCGQLLYTIGGSSCQAVLQVEEADIAQVTVGSPVTLSGPGLGEQQYRAVVTAVATQAKQVLSGLQTKTVVEVTAQLQTEDAALRPGLTVTAKIATGPRSSGVSVPYQAVAQDEQKREYVYTLVDGKPQKQFVVVQSEQSDFMQVAGGLQNGQPVVFGAEEFDPAQQHKMVYRENWDD